MEGRKKRLLDVALQMMIGQRVARREDEKQVQEVQKRLEAAFHRGRLSGYLDGLEGSVDGAAAALGASVLDGAARGASPHAVQHSKTNPALILVRCWGAIPLNHGFMAQS